MGQKRKGTGREGPCKAYALCACGRAALEAGLDGVGKLSGADGGAWCRAEPFALHASPCGAHALPCLLRYHSLLLVGLEAQNHPAWKRPLRSHREW